MYATIIDVASVVTAYNHNYHATAYDAYPDAIDPTDKGLTFTGDADGRSMRAGTRFI